MSTQHAKAPTRGLVVMSDPLNRILTGKKTLELRGKHNRKLGSMALIRKGSGLVFGIAEISESIGPFTLDELRRRTDEHGVTEDRMQGVFDRGWVYGWRLRNVRALRIPVPYVHKGMSQVNLDQKAIDQIQLQVDWE